VVHATWQRIHELKDLKKSVVDKAELVEINSWLRSMRSFEKRLHWRDHFMQKLEDQPDIEFNNFNRGFDGLREDDWNDDYFHAWCQGQTGYPLVDACMRCLHQTGWINFRMRAMLVSFASYQLWLHWRPTSVYLASQFLDFEPGIHFSQFQMQSGTTGINTIRMYSPIKQAKDQDPTGQFIRQWVPELANVPDEFIAEPHTMPPLLQSMAGFIIGQDYPEPIVDHGAAYKRAQKRIYAAKSQPSVRAASDKVYRRHGSRKRPRD
jgi:deoxyribodipyrimidine photo-lyase